MRKMGIVLVVGLFLAAVSFLPVARQSAGEMGVEIGDYWKYGAGAEIEGMSLDASMKMKVTGTEGSGADEVYVIAVTGEGDVSGVFINVTVSGSVDYSGEMKRLRSNFSLVYSNVEMIISMQMSGFSVKMTMGTEMTYSPALDDYIGDDNPGHGATTVSRSNVTVTTTMKLEMPGFPTEPQTETSTDLAVLTMHIQDSNQSVTVPAGTFDCYKYTYDLDVGGDSEIMTYYYSDEVGNYVKQEGMADVSGGFGNGELEAYSYQGHGTGASSLFSGANILIIILVIAAVVVVVSLILMMIRRGRAAVSVPMSPPETYVPPPPPPGA